MAKICLCLTANTLERDMEIIEKYRKYADMAELRVDCLDPDERFLIRRFPEMAGLPVILTIRRDIDGGKFSGGEGMRINLLARGLAFAEADRRRNFACVDIEEDLNVPSLEEAARTFGTRIIRSYHNMQGLGEDIPAKIRSMNHAGDELIKISVMAQSTADVLRLLRAGQECPGLQKILICMGHYGVFTRILAECFDSYMSYAGAPAELGVPVAAAGQLDIQELAELYRFRTITKNTKVYGVVGKPLKATKSPYFFNTVFGLEDIDAVYIPFPADSISDFMELARELNLSGLSVTVPFKEAIIPFLDEASPGVRSIGACNTVCRCPQGWLGTNTDTSGFSDSLLEFIGRTNLRRQRITVIGAGGAARAVVSEIHRLGGSALILNRTIHKAKDLASPYRFAWGGIDNQGIEMMEKYSDIIIQTTTAGMEGSEAADPLETYSFSGGEEVMDLVYQPEVTPFLKRAADAGCRVINGYDMLIRQAQYQYAQFMGRDFPSQLLSRLQFNRT
ncbi:MAG: type I 3-dehydroquinate dehydratase [Treponema sp.]|nr:type I 3-dehydroquinate dehydratase [Treponema sp.]